jgi:hypothetical protein
MRYAYFPFKLLRNIEKKLKKRVARAIFPSLKGRFYIFTTKFSRL